MLSKMFVFLCLLVPLGANAATVAVGSTTINFNGFSTTNSSSINNNWSANPLALQGGLTGPDVDYYEVTLTELTSSREDDPIQIDFYSQVYAQLQNFTRVFQLCAYSYCDGPVEIGVTTNISQSPVVYFFDRLVEGAPNQTNSDVGRIYWGFGTPGTVTVAGALNVTAFANVSPVPLPAAAWLFGSALLGLIGYSRRKGASTHA